jgi:hypothetical protein
MKRKVNKILDTQFNYVIKYEDGTVKIQKKIKSEVKNKDYTLIVFEDGSSIKKYKNPGRPTGIKNKVKPATQQQLDHYWILNYNNNNACVICDNTGVIDTSAVNGRLNICICPIGREIIQKQPNYLQEYYNDNLKLK